MTVDDQEVFRELARQVVEATPGFESLGEVASGEEAIPAVAELNPDMVVIDVRMPGMGGVEAARRIAAAHPDTVVVLISVEDPMDIPSDAEASGAVGARSQGGLQARAPRRAVGSTRARVTASVDD